MGPPHLPCNIRNRKCSFFVKISNLSDNESPFGRDLYDAVKPPFCTLISVLNRTNIVFPVDVNFCPAEFLPHNGVPAGLPVSSEP